jgi:sugar O-acyltransferase (sialic acid O-acetyltransferase NeuD family)
MVDTASSRLFILGAGGFGRELRAWISTYRLPFSFAGFLDNFETGADIVGRIDGHKPQRQDRYIAAIGSPEDRSAVAATIEAAGGSFVNVVSPHASLTSSLPHDAGIVLVGNASIANGVTIGRHTLFQGFSVIGHQVAVGAFCTISSFAFVGGGARIGRRVTVHPHVTVLPNVVVGDDAVLGAGSVVTRNVEARTTVFGNPAKLLVRRSVP